MTLETMKRLPLLLCVLIALGGLGLGLLLQARRMSEPKVLQQTQGQKSPSLAKKSDAASTEPMSIITPTIQAHPNIEQEKTALELLWRVPQTLRPRAVMGFDEPDNHTDGVIRRAIVATDSTLGKMLILEYKEQDRIVQHLYSAEHLVVPLGQITHEKRILSTILQGGFNVTKPFPDADFFYALLDVETPSALFDLFDSLSAELKGLADVELDGAGSGGGTPSDPSYSLQWHHLAIDSPDAWDRTQGDDSIIVAVLDTGVNTSLPEFSGRIVSGYDYANNDSNPADDHGHGTAVAGAIAANANNGVLVAGVDWKCKLMPVKVLDSSNWGYYSWWAAGVNYAKNNGARVINLSAGGSGSSSILTGAIDSAINDGVVFVTITQNDGVGLISYPGSLTQAITVGATERNDTKSSFSNWGPQIDIVAPGRDIYTVNRNGNLDWWWGTSFAAPQVSGVAALLLSINPALDQNSVAALLVAGAEDQVGDSLDVAGFDNYYGWGRLNAYNSILLAQTLPNIAVLPNRDIRLTWAASPNAEFKNPYKIKWSSNMIEWNRVDSPQISYGSTAEWIDDGSETDPPSESFKRFYLIEIGME